MLNTQQLYSYYKANPQVQTDTRKIQKGDLFFALKGPHFNGNKFAQEALDKGASYAIIDEAAFKQGEKMLLVSNVLESLQKLAAYHRTQLHIPFIAITGSNGKTTTKELTLSVLQTTYKTYATEGNLNNHIGIPLTLLRIPTGTEIAVIEMGANHQKEIESYCQIVKPTHGLITNIGKAHLEGFGGIEGVKKGKGELFDYLKQNPGTAFFCTDSPYFKEMTKGLTQLIQYGTSQSAPVHGRVITAYPYLEVHINYGHTISTHLSGDYNLYNILAAATIGKYFNVTQEDVQASISAYIPQNARSQIIKKANNTIILDAYNANPSSMRAAIKDFADRPGNNKYLFLGAMMELGEDSIREHQELIQFITQYQWEKVILVGGDFKKIRHSFIYFDTVAQASDWYQNQHLENVMLLIKGSRSIEMEDILK